MPSASTKTLSALLAVAVLVAGVLPVAAGDRDGKHRGTKRWSWLEGTVWYVPTGNLSATMTSADSDAVVPLRDQTVYTIDGYADGYYWGVSRAQLLDPGDPASVPPDSDPTCNRMVASVTPEGTLNVSFTPKEGTNGSRVTGIGNMRRRRGEWVMQLQMTTGDVFQVTHWAYMRACPKRGQCDLPAIDATAKEFVDACR